MQLNKFSAIVAACVIATVSIVASIAYYDGLGLKAEVWASWVGALGSLAAFFGAVGIYRHQSRRNSEDLACERLETQRQLAAERALNQRELAAERRKNQLEKQVAIFALADASNDRLIKLVEAFDVSERVGSLGISAYIDQEYSPAVFSHALRALAAVPLHELRSYDLVNGIIHIIDALDRAIRVCNDIEQANADEYGFFESHYNAVMDLERCRSTGYKLVYAATVEARTLFHVE